MPEPRDIPATSQRMWSNRSLALWACFLALAMSIRMGFMW